jgi:hypothetical protein
VKWLSIDTLGQNNQQTWTRNKLKRSIYARRKSNYNVIGWWTQYWLYWSSIVDKATNHSSILNSCYMILNNCPICLLVI